MIEGVAIPDNREERFVQLARDFVELSSEYEWEELPLPAREALMDWMRQFFDWAVHRQ